MSQQKYVELLNHGQEWFVAKVPKQIVFKSNPIFHVVMAGLMVEVAQRK